MSRPTDQCTRCLQMGHRASQCKQPTADARAHLPVKPFHTPRWETIAKLTAEALPLGATMGMYREKTGWAKDTVTSSIVWYLRHGRLFKAGRVMHQRYFLTQEQADAAAPELERLEEERIEAEEAAKKASREAWAARYKTSAVLELVRRPGGVNRAEVMKETGLSQRGAQQSLCNMAERGQAFPALPGNQRRYFGTLHEAQQAERERVAGMAAKAEAILARRLARYVLNKPAKPVRNPKPGKALIVAGKSVLPSQPLPADAPVIIPESVKVQRIPRAPDRFEVSGPIVGGFATMRPGHYLPDNTWAARALEGRR